MTPYINCTWGVLHNGKAEALDLDFSRVYWLSVHRGGGLLGRGSNCVYESGKYLSGVYWNWLNCSEK